MTETTHNELLKRVVSDPNVCGGEPCISGTRILIAVILSSLGEGLTAAQIVAHYPPLTEDDVKAAVAYAAALQRGRNEEPQAESEVCDDKLAAFDRLRGLLKFEGGPPTDEEVKDMITDYLVEKYS